MGQEAAAKSPVAGVVAIIGGAIAAIGSFLPWISVTFDFSALGTPAPTGSPTSESVGGLTTDGKITLVLAIAAIVAGLLMVAASGAGLKRGMAILALVGGLLVAGDVALNLATKNDQLDSAFGEGASEIATQLGISAEEAEAQLREFLSVGYAYGIYVTLVGGVVALIGGVMGLKAKGGTAAADTAEGAGWAPGASATPTSPDLGTPPPDSGPGGDLGVPPPPMP